jgi:hypothetical protein
MPVPLDDDGAAASGDGRAQERDAEPEGEANHEDEIGEDVEPMRKAPSPYLPSAAEIEEHRKTHIPYRSWCTHCILGRALGEKRGTHAGREHTIPRIGIDYFFLSAEGVHKRPGLVPLGYPMDEGGEARLDAERSEGRVIKCFIIRCHETKVIMAHVVPQKGVDEHRMVLDLILDDLRWIGHSKMILKCDNEPAIKALVSDVCELVKKDEQVDRATVEHPPQDSMLRMPMRRRSRLKSL